MKDSFIFVMSTALISMVHQNAACPNLLGFAIRSVYAVQVQSRLSTCLSASFPDILLHFDFRK